MATEHYELMNAVQARIKGLNLTLADDSVLPSAQVYLRKLATDRNTTLPCVIVSLGQETEDVDDGNFEADYTGYPIIVTHVFAANQELTVDETPLRWRKAIRRAFDGKYLDTTNPNIRAFRCTVQPQPIINVSLFREQNLEIGALMIRCYAEETRDKADHE